MNDPASSPSPEASPSSSSTNNSSQDAPLLLSPLDEESQLRRRAVRTGVVALIAMVLFVSAVLLTGPLSVWSGPRLRVDFSFCGPIKPGASVRLAGVVVGVVERVQLLAGQDPEAGPDAMVRVHLRIKDEVASLLTTQTQFFVTTLGVLGEYYLDIAPARRGSGEPLQDGARVAGVNLARPDLLLPAASALLQRADALLPTSEELAQLMSTTSSLLSTADALLSDPKQSATLQAGLGELRALVSDARALVRGAAHGVGDGRSLRATLAGLPAVLEKTARVEDQVLDGELPATMQELRSLLTHVGPVVDQLAASPALDPARQADTLDELRKTLRALEDVSLRAARLLSVVEAKEGAAGKLFYDEAVADDLKHVLGTLRRNPWDLVLPKQ
jgi:ABC-type transporter Mla subunit MlaD